jgi:hypothetical protein
MPGTSAGAHACSLANLHDLADGCTGCAGHGNDDLVDVVLAGQVRDALAAAQDAHALEQHAVFERVIVHKAGGDQAGLRVLAQLAQHHRAGLARAGDQDVLDRGPPGRLLLRARCAPGPRRAARNAARQ